MSMRLMFSEVNNAPEDVQRLITEFRDGLLKHLIQDELKLINSDMYKAASGKRASRERTEALKKVALYGKLKQHLLRDYASPKGDDLIHDLVFREALIQSIRNGQPQPRRVIRCDLGAGHLME